MEPTWRILKFRKPKTKIDSSQVCVGGGWRANSKMLHCGKFIADMHVLPFCVLWFTVRVIQNSTNCIS